MESLQNILKIIEEYDVLPDLGPLGVEGIVPLNPARYPAYLAGSACGSDPSYGLYDSLMTPGVNLVDAYEYLDTSRSVQEYAQRLETLTRDTFYVNSLCESGEEVGSFTAGLYANQCCEEYMKERILAANEQLTFEQDLQIALTRRKMQDAILETKHLTYDEALFLINLSYVTEKITP